MSKIQKALRKMQDQARANGDSERQQEAVHREPVLQRRSVGQHVDGRDETGIRIPPGGDGGLIEVDREMLRDAGYLAPADQERFLAEQYRILKRPLIDNAFGRGAYMGDDANLIMVTSALPGDGKTFNCINLALSMAIEKDVSVLLVDADVAKPHISRLFGIDDKPGLIDLLKDKSIDVDTVVMRTDIPGLRILPAGCPDEHATELLASRRMGKVINELSKAYPDRVVIFDSPPILATSESRVLASFMGQIVMVVCAGWTPQQAVEDALENLDDSKAINLILNQSASGSGSASYGAYKYGYGSKK